jgi:hypothetical protein
MNRIRVQPSPLSNTIYAGRINKDGSAWQGEKHDVTSDVIGSIIQYVGAGNIISVNEDGKPAYEIEVRAIKAEVNGNQSGDGALGGKGVEA